MEADEEEEANINALGRCYTCGQEGHLQKDCNKELKQTVQNTKDKGKPKYQSENKERNWVSKPQDGANRGGYSQRKRPECILCRKKGHTLTKCFIFQRAQKILKTKWQILAR